MKLAIYPGSFDPLTFGHADLVYRAARLFDRLVIAILETPRTPPMFTIEERVEMARTLARDLPNVSVDKFDGLLVHYVRDSGARAIVRGLRAFSDFEYEFQMALSNRKMAHEVETLFMMPKEDYSYVSSSIVREIAGLGGDTSDFAPAFVCDALKRKLNHKRKKDAEQQ